MQKAAEKIKQITAQKYVKLTDGGNSAIFFALLIAKLENKKTCYIPDMAGWLTYETYPKILGFEIIKIKTNYGIIDKPNLKLKQNSVIIWQNTPGYFAVQDMSILLEACNKTNSILINDATADLSRTTGNIIVGSFGKGKPINLGYGGFIATNNADFWKHKEYFNIINVYDVEKKLLSKIDKFQKNLEFLKKLSNKVKHDLGDMDIIHKEHDGINIIIKFKNQKQKQQIISYCEKNAFEYTLCPRYIRVLDDAISIEIKRKIDKK